MQVLGPGASLESQVRVGGVGGSASQATHQTPSPILEAEGQPSPTSNGGVGSPLNPSLAPRSHRRTRGILALKNQMHTHTHRACTPHRLPRAWPQSPQSTHGAPSAPVFSQRLSNNPHLVADCWQTQITFQNKHRVRWSGKARERFISFHGVRNCKHWK